jgi:hypothetical protein
MSLEFRCTHCNAENTVEPRLAGCVMNCSGCGRSIIVPTGPPLVVPTVAAGPVPAWFHRTLVASLFALGAAVVLGGISLVVSALIERQTVGMTLVDVVVVGIIGALAGAILGGMIGWRIARE